MYNYEKEIILSSENVLKEAIETVREGVLA